MRVLLRAGSAAERSCVEGARDKALSGEPVGRICDTGMGLTGRARFEEEKRAMCMSRKMAQALLSGMLDSSVWTGATARILLVACCGGVCSSTWDAAGHGRFRNAYAAAPTAPSTKVAADAERSTCFFLDASFVRCDDDASWCMLAQEGARLGPEMGLFLDKPRSTSLPSACSTQRDSDRSTRCHEAEKAKMIAVNRIMEAN